MIRNCKNKSINRLKTLSYSLVFLFTVSSFSFMFSITHANELIEEAFAPAKLQETIINLGNTKDSV
ncbi:hypothetical protein KKH82_08350 [Patescibacteria group bacterium]|nr:hypothetical protein [Patescibacteria group bacterium]